MKPNSSLPIEELNDLSELFPRQLAALERDNGEVIDALVALLSAYNKKINELIEHHNDEAHGGKDER